MTDTDRRTEPAMDAEEWGFLTDDSIEPLAPRLAQAAVEATLPFHDISRHALAALALYQQPFGFTHDELDELLNADPELPEFWDRLERILAKVRALLPPR